MELDETCKARAAVVAVSGEEMPHPPDTERENL